MNLKIGEFVEYVTGLKTGHERRMRKLKDVLEGLAQENTHLREEIDGLEQMCANLEKQAALAEERVESCKKAVKEVEDKWSKRDENIVYWFKANNFSEDCLDSLLKFLVTERT